MFQPIRISSTIAVALTACLLVATTAQAGGYPTNGCVAKKQATLGKYAKDVGKAWAKYPSDATARNAAIAKSFEKLDKTWVKEEAKSLKKNAACDAATSSSTDAAAEVETAIGDLALATEDSSAVAEYIADSLKAYGKYNKDPNKDLGKVKLAASLGKSTTDNLTGANGAVTSGATTLEAELVRLTTTAPNYPDTFQTIVPGSSVMYGKKELKPICVDGDPYMYFARRGTSNNVLMYYQGGGACWDSSSCNVIGTCDRISDASDSPDNTTTGFADYDNPANPFHDWSVVFVSYCSCDVHWGEKTTVYSGGKIFHRGRVNASVAEKFAREHFIDPDKVFVTGSSAGSYGAIMNSYYLMNGVWPNAEYAVVGDAGVGVITKQWLDTYIKNWGVDKNFPTDLPGISLPVENLSLVTLIDAMSDKFPNNRFANYDSSYDGGSGSQTQFFQVMRYPTPPIGNIVDKWPNYWEPACMWNACMREFKADNATKSSNYHYFTGAGSRHTIFGSDKVFTETKSTKSDGTPMTFAAWVTAMIDDTADWVDVDCNHPGGDCNLTNSCQGGDNPGVLCTSDADCVTGGTCQDDPDNGNAPYANNDTVTCAPTTCPCGPTAATCAGGINDGSICTTDADCKDDPNDIGEQGTCTYVNCAAP